MTPSPDDLAARYAGMSETELMELARSYDGLLETAQVALRAEFARRGLEPPLVEAPEEWQFRRLVTVRRYRDLAEAYVGRSLLESAGIPAWIADENLVRMDWFYSNLVGGMRLQVDERDEAAAREILEQGKFGRLISVDDVAAMAEALRQVLSNPPSAEFLTQARQSALDRYAIGTNIARLESLLCSVAGRS